MFRYCVIGLAISSLALFGHSQFKNKSKFTCPEEFRSTEEFLDANEGWANVLFKEYPDLSEEEFDEKVNEAWVKSNCQGKIYIPHFIENVVQIRALEQPFS